VNKQFNRGIRTGEAFGFSPAVSCKQQTHFMRIVLLKPRGRIYVAVPQKEKPKQGGSWPKEKRWAKDAYGKEEEDGEKERKEGRKQAKGGG
jgi:hypothetical protein